MSDHPDLEARLADAVDHHERHGVLPPSLPPTVAAMAARYLELALMLDDGTSSGGRSPLDNQVARDPQADTLPSIDGFHTIERLGAGGMGEVYKLRDLRLDRIVAAKILRRDQAGRLSASARDFLREAQSLALFSDSRIVQIFEYRLEHDPAVIIMEYVDGFELGRLGPSLEFRQRAKIMRDVADALERAHALGVQHRDLKPSNIMLDGQLTPKILDFGLSGSDPTRGHLRGTVEYVAPEQLDPSQPIDRRTDVYAMGVILYELLCGVPPYQGETAEDVLAAVRHGEPKLPAEAAPDVPPALQAIALKAMERRPVDRYQTARDMVRDLDRFLAGQTVDARPTLYATTLGNRVRPHLDQIGEWLRLKLIYPHEAARLESSYQALEKREDDWIVASRVLSYSQIVLYLGAFVLFVGSVFYFNAHRSGSVTGLWGPALVLGLPFVGLNVAARWLYGRDHQAVAVAFYLAGVSLLPLFLMIAFRETHILAVAKGTPNQLFEDGWISNSQLQITIAVAFAWSAWLALRTRTGALSTLAVLLVFLLTLAVLADYGLRDWIDPGNHILDHLSFRLLALIPIYGVAGWALERQDRAWFARPSFVAVALTLVLAVDLLAQDGKLFYHLGIGLDRLQPAKVDPVILPTYMALSLNGVLFYAAAEFFERYGTVAMTPAATFLFIIAPFSMLEPLAYLSETHDYDVRFDWSYLGLAVAIAVISHARQRKSFFYAGLLNCGIALYLIAERYEWFDNPAWAKWLVAVGLAGLIAGYVFDARRRRQSP